MRCHGWRVPRSTTCSPPSAAAMKAADVARAMYPDYKEERVGVVAEPPKQESDWFGLKKAKGAHVQGAGGRRCTTSTTDPIPIAASTATCRCASLPMAARCGRSHRRHHDAGRSDHDLPDPVTGPGRFRRRARTLARRALGRGRSARRFPARIAVQSVNEPARWRRSPGHRRARHQYRQYPHWSGYRRTSRT